MTNNTSDPHNPPRDARAGWGPPPSQPQPTAQPAAQAAAPAGSGWGPPPSQPQQPTAQPAAQAAAPAGSGWGSPPSQPQPTAQPAAQAPAPQQQASSGWGPPPGQAQPSQGAPQAPAQSPGSGWGPAPAQAGGWQAPAGAANRKADWQRPASEQRSLTERFFKPPPTLSERARPVYKVLTILSLHVLIPMFLAAGFHRIFSRRSRSFAPYYGVLMGILFLFACGLVLGELLGLQPHIVAVPMTLVLAAPLIVRHFLHKLMP